MLSKNIQIFFIYERTFQSFKTVFSWPAMSFYVISCILRSLGMRSYRFPKPTFKSSLCALYGGVLSLRVRLANIEIHIVVKKGSFFSIPLPEICFE